MDVIINVLLLVIIFVFDPLAIALVIAANYAFERLKPKENIYGEKFVDGELWDEIEESEDWEEYEPNDELKRAAEKYKEAVKKDDWVVVDEEEFDEFDLDRDGIIDENETTFKHEVERIRSTPGLSAWRKNKMIRELKEKLFNNK